MVVSLMSYSFQALYLPVNFPSVYVVDKYGLRMGTIFGIVLSTVGLWIRCFVNMNFYTLLVGQIFMGIGQPFLYNAPALVTTNWFPQKERSVATMVGTQMNVFGVLLGFLLPMIFIDPYEKDQKLNDEEKDSFRSQIFNMMLASALFSTVITLLVLFTFRDKPGVPIWSTKVSHQEDQETKSESELSIKEQYILCFTNKTYMFTAISTCLVMVHMFVFNTIIG